MADKPEVNFDTCSSLTTLGEECGDDFDDWREDTERNDNLDKIPVSVDVGDVVDVVDDFEDRRDEVDSNDSLGKDPVSVDLLDVLDVVDASDRIRHANGSMELEISGDFNGIELHAASGVVGGPHAVPRSAQFARFNIGIWSCG